MDKQQIDKLIYYAKSIGYLNDWFEDEHRSDYARGLLDEVQKDKLLSSYAIQQLTDELDVFIL